MSQFFDDVSYLVLWHGVQDVCAALTSVAGKSVLLVLPASTVSCVALLEDSREIRACFGELFVGYCAWVVDDLVCSE